MTWLVLTLGGVMAASSLGGALSQKFSIPRAAIRTNEQIGHEFGSGGSPLVPVVRVARGDLRQPALARQVNRAFSAVAAAAPGSRVASYATTGDAAFLSPDHRTEYALIFTPGGVAGQQLSGTVLDAARHAARSVSVAGASVNVTGIDALRTAETQSKGNGVMVEAMLGVGGALVVLAFVFASFIAVVPLLTASVAIVSTLLIIRGLAALTAVSMTVQYLIALIGLGVAIDYALLVIVRWREEHAKGQSNEQAIVARWLPRGGP